MIPSINSIDKNLEYWYHHASDSLKQQGESWYLNAHQEALRLASKWDVSLAQSAGIIARLSPAISWERNVIAADNLLAGKSKIDGYAFNVQIARQIASGKFGNTFDSVKKSFPENTAPKITRFYGNIYSPLDRETITIDRWMVRAAFNPKIAKGLNIDPKINIQEYRIIAYAVRSLAYKYHYIPCQMQAIIWESIRQDWTAK